MSGTDPDGSGETNLEVPDSLGDTSGVAGEPDPKSGGLSDLTKEKILAILGITTTGTWAFLVRLGRNPQQVIFGFTEDFIFQRVLQPIASQFYLAGIAFLRAIIELLFGSDMAVGIAPGSTVGIVDLPFLVLGPSTGTVVVVGDLIVAPINTFNQGLAALVQPLGLAAPTVVTAFWLVEISLVVWGAYLAFQTIDVFTAGVLGEIAGVLWAATWPVRRLWRWFF